MQTNTMAQVLKILLLLVSLATGATQLLDSYKGIIPEKYAVSILAVCAVVLGLSRPIIKMLDPDGDGVLGVKPQDPPSTP